MMRARRVILIALIFLIIGGAVNVGVAWAMSQPHQLLVWRAERQEIPASRWPGPVPGHWPERPFMASRRDVARGHSQLYMTGQSEWLPEEWGFISFELLQARSGWPALSLEQQAVDEHRIRVNTRSFLPRYEPLPSFWYGGLRLGSANYPIRPLWPGFAINTIVYALAAMALFIVPRSTLRFARTINRRRRSACISCGYSRAGLAADAVCPECGGVPKA